MPADSADNVQAEYFDGFANELNGKFQRLRHLVKHNGTSGNYHEGILRTVLRNFLTKRYSVKTGFIYKNSTEVSNQMDIIIVDENSPAAYVFQEGDFAVVMPEAVVAFIEVKTTLTSQELESAVDNIASAKSLYERACPLGIIFGYQSDVGEAKMNDAKLASRLQSDAAKRVQFKAGDGIHITPDSIIWLNDNYAVLGYDIQSRHIVRSGDYHSFQSPTSQIGWQLSILLAQVVGACEAGEFKKTHMFGNNQANRLLSTGIMEVSDQVFRFGTGATHPTQS